MAQKVNYTSSKGNYTWTGIRTRNQLWSYFYVDEPIVVTHIDLYWGGYDKGTKGRHFIAKWTSGNGARLGDIVVQSAVISVPMGRGWRRATVKKTYLERGGYAVGVWGDHLGRRIVGAWNGADGGRVIYTHTNTSIRGNVTGDDWRNKPGVIPARLQYEPASAINIRVGSWRKSKGVWVRAGSWRKSKAIWVKSGGTWRRSK